MRMPPKERPSISAWIATKATAGPQSTRQTPSYPSRVSSEATLLSRLATAGFYLSGGGFLGVMVDDVDLPGVAVRVADPELVLVRVAAVRPHLLLDGQPRRLHATQVPLHLGAVAELNPEVSRADAGLPGRHRQVDRGEGRQ